MQLLHYTEELDQSDLFTLFRYDQSDRWGIAYKRVLPARPWQIFTVQWHMCVVALHSILPETNGC
jgi:hypothetical protein